MKLIYNNNNITPQYDDIEAEITCLLLLEYKPNNIKEFSPCGGWSTNYLLKSCPETSKIESFDIHDTCIQNVNASNWKFTKDDVSLHYERIVKEKPDYLFIDSDHSTEFTQKYIDNLLTNLIGTKCIVSVHDVYHHEKPSYEGELVIEFLKKNNISYFSPANKIHNNDFLNLKNELNIADKIHYYSANPSIYFIL